MPISNSANSDHSDKLRIMISKAPSGTLKWGSTIIFIMLVIVITLVCLTEYSVKIHFKFRVISINRRKITGEFLDTSQIASQIKNERNISLTFSKNGKEITDIKGVVKYTLDNLNKNRVQMVKLNILTNPVNTKNYTGSDLTVDAQTVVNNISLYEQIKKQIVSK